MKENTQKKRPAGVEVVVCQVESNSLEDAMQQANLSHEETAMRTGLMSSRQLARLIRMEHCPSLERAIALSTVLGRPVNELFVISVKTRPAK